MTGRTADGSRRREKNCGPRSAGPVEPIESIDPIRHIDSVEPPYTGYDTWDLMNAALRQLAAERAGLAEMLAEVDEFLRSPGGHAALDEWYRARGLSGLDSGMLVDQVGLTLFSLRKYVRQNRQHS